MKKNLSSNFVSFGLSRAAFLAALLFLSGCGDTFTSPIAVTYSLTRDVLQKGMTIHIETEGHYQEAADNRWTNQAEATLSMNGLEEPIHLKLLFISNAHEKLISNKLFL